MKVNKVEFEEKEEEQKFERVETRKGLAELHRTSPDPDVNPFADTVQMDAVNREAGPDQKSRASIDDE